MTINKHVIVYAAPAHEPVPTIECSCGWTTTGDDADGRGHREVMSELLGEWLEHVELESGP
ncbi:MAG TPA: hypothetical protein VF481_14305 [Novosphingobium sp.]